MTGDTVPSDRQVGFGEIGKQGARIARGFGMPVLVHDPFVRPDAATEHQVTLVKLDELLSRACGSAVEGPTGPRREALNQRPQNASSWA